MVPATAGTITAPIPFARSWKPTITEPGVALGNTTSSPRLLVFQAVPLHANGMSCVPATATGAGAPSTWTKMIALLGSYAGAPTLAKNGATRSTPIIRYELGLPVASNASPMIMMPGI